MTFIGDGEIFSHLHSILSLGYSLPNTNQQITDTLFLLVCFAGSRKTVMVS